jgi:hypothetical protein
LEYLTHANLHLKMMMMRLPPANKNMEERYYQYNAFIVVVSGKNLIKGFKNKIEY